MTTTCAPGVRGHHEAPRYGYGFPPGSVVIDPFGYIGDQPGVTVIRVGRKT